MGDGRTRSTPSSGSRAPWSRPMWHYFVVLLMANDCFGGTRPPNQKYWLFLSPYPAKSILQIGVFAAVSKLTQLTLSAISSQNTTLSVSIKNQSGFVRTQNANPESGLLSSRTNPALSGWQFDRYERWSPSEKYEFLFFHNAGNKVIVGVYTYGKTKIQVLSF